MSEIIWRLTPKKANPNTVELIVKIANKQPINLSEYDVVQIGHVVFSFKDQIVDYLIEHGYSSLVASELVLEYVVPKGTPDDKILKLIHRYLDKISVDDELIIVDPYFFAKKPKNPNYVNLLGDIIDRYIGSLKSLVIITNDNVDSVIKGQIESMLKGKKPSLNITHKQHYDYHDRYWISGARENGILMGTSLNSLGNKMALLDRLKKPDVRDIVNDLKKNGLI